MSGLMGSFGVGVSGLKLSQASLTTTAHNLANVDTLGYVRQQAEGADASYNNIGKTAYNTKQIGLGANMAAIRQVREQFLDKAYRREIGRQGFYDAGINTVNEIEDLLGEMTGVSFQDSIEELWMGIQELIKEPDSVSKRAALVETGVSFIERAENISNQLDAYQQNLNTEIQKEVDSINAMGERIRQLNIEIAKYECGQEKANDLRDERNLLLDELGQKVKISYQETKAGIVTVNIEGMQFVTEDVVAKLSTEKISESSNLYKVVWKGYGGTDLYPSYSVFEEKENEDGELEREETRYVYLTTSTADDTDIGYLKGLLVARGNYRANYTDIPLAPKMEDYITEDGEGKEEYDEAYAQYLEKVEDYNKTIDGSVLMRVQAQFDQLIHSVVKTINDILCPNADVDSYIANLGLEGDSSGASLTYTNADGEEISLSGDELSGILLWDEGTAPLGMDENRTGGEAFFERKSVKRYMEGTISLPDGTEKRVLVYNQEDKEDNYSLFTLGEMEVNKEILHDYSKLPLSANKYQGQDQSYDIEACRKLSDAWDNVQILLDPNTLTTTNFADYYTDFIGALALDGEQIENTRDNQKTMVDQIDNSRQDVIGVSSDEELGNLIKYQQAYNANSRYVTTISDMLEYIIERLG